MLKILSVKLVRDVYDNQEKTIWFGSEKYDELKFIPNQPILIQLEVDYHIDEEVDEKIDFRIRIDDEIIHTEPRELKIPYAGKSTDIKIPHTIHDVQFRKPGLNMIDIVLGNDILYSMPIKLT